MNRREFLQTSAGAALAPAVLRRNYVYAEEFAQKKARVGLIGTGWYGKSDLFRLLQVAPVEVVSLCDVDKKMLADCAEQVASRQESKKTPRTYGDYRAMLKEKDLDIVLIATPDHWHALPMIAACEAGADIYVQKPISVDVVEGQAMLSAARKHKRVVQVGTQRRSTPHLIEAIDQIIKPGKLGKIGLVEIYCYYHMRTRETPPDTAPPDNLDYEMWTGPAPLRPYNKLVHPRSWRAFMEYGNGIMGDMCIHMLDCVRWMLGLGWPQKVSSSGGILIDKDSKANISDTQTATFDFGAFPVVWQHRTYGHPPDAKYPWGLTIYGDKGTL
ncbi:MAG: Gfo/Idh/MocA family protein, partial [Blastocatellia bacterium]